jgi:hypothetical protein
MTKPVERYASAKKAAELRRQQRREARAAAPRRGRAIDGGIRRLVDVPGHEQRPIIQFDRVSSRQQRANGNLRDAANETRRKLRALSIKPTKRIADVETSSIHKPRPNLMEAIRLARACNGIVVAEFRNRLLRGHDRGVPTVSEFKRFKQMTDGVDFATIEDPDLSEGTVRSMQTKRGHQSRDAKPGRPRTTYLPRATADELAEVKWLRECKCSYGEIALELGRSRATIQSWVKRSEQSG